MSEMKRLNEKFGVYRKDKVKTKLISIRVDPELLSRFNLVHQQAKDYGFQISKTEVVAQALESIIDEWEEWYAQH